MFSDVMGAPLKSMPNLFDKGLVTDNLRQVSIGINLLIHVFIFGAVNLRNPLFCCQSDRTDFVENPSNGACVS